MKLLPFICAVFLAAAGAAGAQDAPRPPLSRGDVQFVIGWQNLHREQPGQHYNNWLNNILYGGAGVGCTGPIT